MKKVLLFDIDGTLVHSKNPFRLYPETTEVINRLKEKYILGIYSQGYRAIQSFKLSINDIKKYFDPKFAFISLNKVKLLNTYFANNQSSESEFIVIDNELAHLSGLAEYKNLRKVFLQRNSPTIDSEYITINDLIELEKLL